MKSAAIVFVVLLGLVSLDLVASICTLNPMIVNIDGLQCTIPMSPIQPYAPFEIDTCQYFYFICSGEQQFRICSKGIFVDPKCSKALPIACSGIAGQTTFDAYCDKGLELNPVGERQ